MSDQKKFLYHGTSFEALTWIIRLDELRTSDSDGPTGASTTDSVEVASMFANGTSKERAWEVDYYTKLGWTNSDFCPSHQLLWTLFKEHGGFGANIVFDRTKLEQNFELEPFDAHGDNNERELRIVGAHIENIVNCIDRIDILNEGCFIQYARALKTIDPEFSDSIKKIVNLASDPSDDLLALVDKPKPKRFHA